MPWFYCDDCGDTIKKPKVGAHVYQCSASSFTCIDCSRQFDQTTVHGHTQCVTEHDKYAKGATKPGGFAEKGYFAKSDIAKCSEQDASMQNADEVIGEQFLSAFAPWKCSICSVTCTSRETLLGHAQGAKHKRRSKAALGVTVENGKEGSVHLQTQQNLDQSKTNKENSNVDKKAIKVKWKSLALDQLKRSNGEMKVKKLVAAIKAASNDGDAEKDYILKKLKKSKKLEFDGKMVRLKFLG